MPIVRKSVANDNAAAVERLAQRLDEAFSKEMPASASFEDLEEVLLAASNEFVRRALERRLQQLADGYGDELLINGTRYRRHQPCRHRRTWVPLPPKSPGPKASSS
jgi:hypothetical protein